MPSGDKQELDFGPAMRGAGKEQKLFGRYTLKRVLGRGGMGIVWLAHDDELLRYVAMKFLPDMLVRDREAVEDLKRETRRSLDLTHHHIVRIYDFTQDEMCAAIIMEFVDGETLSAMKAQQPNRCFGVSVLAPWVAHFASGIDYAHRQARVVHRDLKPANLMINSRGDLKITDFGISRSMSDSMTRVSVSNTAGTLAYMSPEQALGAPPAPGDDIYAFGATVYDLLTGRPPFFRGNLQVQLETVIPPKMADRRTELGNEGEPIPALWEEVIGSCLAKRPQDRPQSIAEVASLLGLSGTSTGMSAGMSTGSTFFASPGTSSTRAHATDDAATDEQIAPATPRTAQPSTNRPTAGPQPTGLADVLGASSFYGESTPAPTLGAPTKNVEAAQTVPPEDLTIYAKTPAEPEAPASKPAPEARSKEDAPPAEAESRSTSTSTPDSTPARKSSSSLAIAALGSLALVAIGGAWLFLSKPGTAPEPTRSTSQTEPAAPEPDYGIQVAAIRELIDAERLAPAAEHMAKLPPTLPALAELRAALESKQADITKREGDEREMTKKKATIAQLIADSDASYAKNEWTAARAPLLRILAEFEPANAEAKARLGTIEAAEKKAAMQREEDAFRAIISGATAALASGEFTTAKSILDTVPSSFAGDPEVTALNERIDKAKLAAMTPPTPVAPPAPPTPVVEEPSEPKVTKSTTTKPKASTAQTSRPTRRDDDDDKPARRTQPAPVKTAERPPAPVVNQKKEAPPAPTRSKTSINKGTNIGG